jgi:hypothetical protein
MCRNKNSIQQTNMGFYHTDQLIHYFITVFYVIKTKIYYETMF